MYSLLEFRGCANDKQRNVIGREPFANAQRFSTRRYNYICMSGNRYRIAISYESKTKVRHRICSAKDFNNARNIPTQSTPSTPQQPLPPHPTHTSRPDGLLQVNPDARHPILDLSARAEEEWNINLPHASCIREYITGVRQDSSTLL
jgi:hypothetical protein